MNIQVNQGLLKKAPLFSQFQYVWLDTLPSAFSSALYNLPFATELFELVLMTALLDAAKLDDTAATGCAERAVLEPSLSEETGKMALCFGGIASFSLATTMEDDGSCVVCQFEVFAVVCKLMGRTSTIDSCLVGD